MDHKLVAQLSAVILVLTTAVLAGATAAPRPGGAAPTQIHADDAGALVEQARELRKQGKYADAIALVERAVALDEKDFSPEHPATARDLNLLAVLFTDAGAYAQAEPLYARALAIRTRALGPEHPDTAGALRNLAELYERQGKYAQAEPMFVRALQIYQKAFGPEHYETAAMLSSLARLYENQGQYAQAESLFVHALAIRERALGPEHPDTAGALSDLAGLYADEGKYAQAEPLHVRALQVLQKTLGPEHPKLIDSLETLAGLYRSQGQYAKAEQLYLRALAIGEKALGPEHPKTASALHELALLYAGQGQYAKAEELDRRVLAIREKTVGPEHPDTATSLNNLGLLYWSQGRYADAEPLFLRALAICEKAFGPDHPLSATAVNNLASLYMLEGQSAKAEPLFVRAIAIEEKALGPEHPDTASSVNNLAAFYLSEREYAKAEPLFVRALGVYETALGPEHPMTATLLDNLALLYSATGDFPRAVTMLARANDARERELRRNLACGSESDKLAYLRLTAVEFDQTISLHVLNAPADATAQRIALEIVLRRKGRALDATARQIESLRRRAAPEDAVLLDDLAAAQSALSRATLAGPGGDELDAFRTRVASLRQEVERLEGEVSRRSQQFAVETAPVTLDAVQAAVPDDTALVEFVSYHPFDAKQLRFESARYVVYVTGRDGRVGWADLGDAARIDALVATFRSLVRSKETDVAELRPAARRLDAAVMEPVRRLVGPTKRLLLSPDGALNLVPFAALVDERGRYLVERYEIQYLTSGRDLLRLTPRSAGSRPVVVADPDFGTRPAGSERNVGVAGDAAPASTAVDLSRVVFTPLRGTAEEAAALSELMPCTVLAGSEATEAALKKLDAPAILHIATHGFFLERVVAGRGGGDPARELVHEPPGGQTDPTPAGRLLAQVGRVGADLPVADPLLRSGLGLAGANERLSGAGEDGLLTALEVTGLNLWGTQLVVLSACDTGVGEVRNGDGVYGLRRALVLAGAETTMMSLWPVSDAGTRDLMIAFYRTLLSGRGRSEALRSVQLSMLRDPKRRHPYYWASFIESGAWGPLGPGTAGGAR